MKKILILFIAVLFFSIGGCQKKNVDADKTAFQTNDIVAQLIKENVLSSSTNTNEINTNSVLTEPLDQSNVVKPEATKINKVEKAPAIAQKTLPVEPEVGSASKSAVKDKVIRDQGVQAPGKTTSAKPVQEKPTQEAPVRKAKSGSYIKVGADHSGQAASPRKAIKITTAVFSSGKGSRYADIMMYAVPKGSEPSTEPVYLIVAASNIEMINGQAQFTRYWNGKNVNGDFLVPGRYEFYLVSTVKDADLNMIKKESRFWGGSDKYYVHLY